MLQSLIKTVIPAAVVCALLVPAFAEDPEPKALNKGGTESTDATGAVKGLVKFDGKQAPRKPIAMNADPKCAAAHPDTPALEEKYIFGKNGDDATLVNVLVYIEHEDLKTDPPEEVHLIDQVGCVYTPHVSAAVAGQPVHIRNSDNTMHNVNYKPADGSPNKAFNVAQPVKGMIKKLADLEAEPGAGSLTCQVHPWMNAHLWIMPHAYFAVTQEDGTFEITGLPPGKYTVKTWHAFKPFLPDKESYEVTVEAGKEAEVAVTYAPKKRN